ncbi:MAG: helix-turn-helix domain-containing protein [Saprospiraceae bacterium]|nr:helix-turn-helix domain-containing protein [Saprospiraceae bacterium]MCF8252011.1 helix-turn-helix domain-containing protein [Saprospiraceae bacterium]MCF8281700.1 helix-turn-helix domain-containing protein [Bacteroidales bacterium]MCF8313688.1 helix-turn-helix domain-containing protein [Saprospiraceae bacterium]MCF8442395.1 helix-turn-helix domain-containing protein [Saprospiraceae bacterium]
MFLFFTNPLFSQQLHFRHYGIKDGLVNSGTGSREVILQDKEGFMWFSTHHGISRFDGISFKNFRYDPLNPHSIGNNWTVGLVEADDGKIWAGTADEGLYIFDPETEAFEHVGSEEAGMCGHGMNTFNKDKDGNIWIGTRFNGFCRWVKKTGQFERVGNLKDGHHFYQQKNGTVWLGVTDGLYRVLPNGTPKLIQHAPNVPNDWRFRVVQDQVEMPNGKFLLTSSFEGFWEFDPVAETFRDLTQDFHFKNTKVPYSFLADENGKIWIGADGELWRWNPADGSKTIYLQDDKNPNSIPSTMIPCMAKDRAGSLWLITRGDGVAVAHDLSNPFEMIAQMPVIQLFPLKKNKVVAWSNEGVFTFDTQTKKLTPGGLPIGPLKGIGPKLVRFSTEEILISEGDRSIPKLYNQKTGKIRLLPEGRTSSNLRMAGGRIWDNLLYFDEQANKWVDAFPEMQKNIPGFIASMSYFQDIIHDEGKSIWVSTTGGVYNYNLETKQHKVYRHDPTDPHSLPTVVCQLMYKGGGRNMYLTTTNGLAVYDPANDRFNTYNQQNGLLHDVVNTVVEDANGNPWIGTALGLQKLDLKTGTFTNYDEYDGLPGEFVDEQHGCRDDDGWLYFFMGENSFRFHPDSLPARDYTASVYLLDFFQNHQAVTVGAADSILQKMLRYTPSLTLPFSRNNFGFSFAMPVFYKPEGTTYYYRLLPYQSEWQSAGSAQETHYTNIDPGKYTFQVKAKTATGVWCTAEASIEMIVLPPWYRTWWAYLFYVLAAGGILFGIRRFELRRQSINAEALRLQELDALKSRLYTNITHEFRTPLTVIMGMIENIRGHENERKLIRRNSKNLLRLINQLLDLSKLDSGTMKMDVVQGDIINYLQYLTESFHSMAHEKKVRLTFYSEIPELVMDFDEVKIQHVVYNLLSNAIKFTEAGGKVVLHANQTERNGQPFLKLKVQDTGVGIPQDQVKHIFDRFFQADNSSTRKGEGTGIGLALTKELVELMGGSISVESTAGKGTNFTLLLPIRLEANTPLPQTEFPSSRSLAPELVPDLPAPIVAAPTDETEVLVTEKPVLLVIEDNADVVTYIVGLLEKEYDITTAPNGQVGIEKAFEIIPDIIISDVMMPEKDGYEVCETLKHDERTSHIPIILLTAKAEASDRITGLRKGADAYLMKPFNKEELYVRLEKLLELRRALQLRYAGMRNDIFSKNVISAPSPAEPTLDDRFLQKLQNTVMEHLDKADLGAEELSRAVHLSQSQLYRKMNALTGEPPNAFIRKIRLHRAKEMLESTELNISEIAYSVGFNDPNYFSRAFHKEFGKAPSEYRN